MNTLTPAGAFTCYALELAGTFAFVLVLVSVLLSLEDNHYIMLDMNIWLTYYVRPKYTIRNKNKSLI
jgi:hypothetical protein